MGNSKKVTEEKKPVATAKAPTATAPVAAAAPTGGKRGRKTNAEREALGLQPTGKGMPKITGKLATNEHIETMHFESLIKALELRETRLKPLLDAENLQPLSKEMLELKLRLITQAVKAVKEAQSNYRASIL